jgi:hypothetical protein
MFLGPLGGCLAVGFVIQSVVVLLQLLVGQILGKVLCRLL